MKNFLSLLSVVFIFTGCSKPENKVVTPNPPMADNFIPPFTIKYELVFSKPIKYLNNNTIFYTTDDYQYPSGYQEQISTRYNNQVWTYTFTTHLPINPYEVYILLPDATMEQDGTVTFNLYVNSGLYYTSNMQIVGTGNGWGNSISFFEYIH